MASKEYEEFYHQLIAKALPANLPIEEVRAVFERWMSDYPAPPEIRFEEFSIGNIPACWAFAPGVKRQPVILFFYGGAFSAGSVRSHKGLIGRIGQASGCAVMAIDYRLAPENPFPAALEDALTAYRWLLHHPYPHNHIALAGSSAGGGLLLSLMLRLKLEKMPLPAAGVCICPWVDLSKRKYANRKDLLKPERLIQSAKMYAGARDPKDPFISPLYGDLSGLPPLFIQTGTTELLYEEIVELGSKIENAKLEKWPEMIHCWHLFASKFPEGPEAIERIGLFLKKIFK